MKLLRRSFFSACPADNDPASSRKMVFKLNTWGLRMPWWSIGVHISSEQKMLFKLNTAAARLPTDGMSARQVLKNECSD